MSQVAANDYDRFSFAIFMAGLVHALLIFGIGFALPEKQNSATTLDVTLAQHRDDEAPEDADFLAQTNQLGSGTLDKRAELTTQEEAEYASDTVQKTEHKAQQASAPKASPQAFQSVTSQDSDKKANTSVLEENVDDLMVPNGPTKSLLERSLEIASLEAKLDQQNQMLTKRPRIRRLTATSTRQSNDALYMNQWLHKIERVGNLNYPADARRQKISGSLRLMVALRADGTVHEIQVLESSGHKILDDAAKRIVRLASPFSPFPESMRKQTDILEIIRTWKFQNTLFSTNS